MMARRAAVRGLPLAALLAALLQAGPSGATTPVPDCDSEIAAALQSLAVDQGRVRSIYVSPRLKSGIGATRVVSLDVWVRLTDCKGALVLDLSRHCTLRQAYTRGECRVPGVSAY